MAEREEEALIQTFVAAEKRERYLGFIANPKRRNKLVERLYHFSDFNRACVVEIPANQQTAKRIFELLRARGAPDTCYVVSTNRASDQTRMALAVALDEIVGGGEGTLLSCVTGRLAYFEGESPQDRLILEQRR